MATALGIDHVALQSFDLGASARFYGEILGLGVLERGDGTSSEWGGAWRFLSFELARGGELTLFELASAERPAARGALDAVAHVALRVGSRAELESLRKRLESHGVAIEEELEHDGGRRHSLYVFDPDHNYVELTCRSGRS
jgi:catechol 2,3-dioxygenase